MGTGFTQSQLLTPSDLAKMLNISMSTVYRLVEKRLLPFYKMGGSLRFKIDEVMAYIAKCRVMPAYEMYEHTKTKK